MKNFQLSKYISIALIFLCSSLSHAQIEVSVGAGYNIATANIDENNILSTDSRNGFYISVMPKIGFNENIFINIEGQFSREGHTLNQDDNITENRISYLRFIPHIEIRLAKIIGIYSGINFALKMEETTKLNGETVAEIGDLFDSRDFAIPFGARVYISNFYANISYNIGLSEIQDFTFTDMEGNSLGLGLKNSHIQIGLGYTF